MMNYTFLRNDTRFCAWNLLLMLNFYSIMWTQTSYVIITLNLFIQDMVFPLCAVLVDHGLMNISSHLSITHGLFIMTSNVIFYFCTCTSFCPLHIWTLYVINQCYNYTLLWCSYFSIVGCCCCCWPVCWAAPQRNTWSCESIPLLLISNKA